MYKYVFQRPNAVYGDTGWYGCANYDVDIIPNSFNDNPKVNWIYVYVNCKTKIAYLIFVCDEKLIYVSAFCSSCTYV